MGKMIYDHSDICSDINWIDENTTFPLNLKQPREALHYTLIEDDKVPRHNHPDFKNFWITSVLMNAILQLLYSFHIRKYLLIYFWNQSIRHRQDIITELTTYWSECVTSATQLNRRDLLANVDCVFLSEINQVFSYLIISLKVKSCQPPTSCLLLFPVFLAHSHWYMWPIRTANNRKPLGNVRRVVGLFLMGLSTFKKPTCTG